MSIGERIDYIRANAGCTQKEFSEKLDISESSISRAIAGKQELSASAKRNICSTFSVNLEWLESGTGSIYKASEIVEGLEAILGQYPAILNAIRLASERMSRNDWKKLNDFIESLGGTNDDR